MSVLAIAEHRDGHFRKVTYEALSEGRRIADGMGTDLAALVMGSGVETAAGELGKYGADKIIVADHPRLAEYLTDAYTTVAAGVIAEVAPRWLSWAPRPRAKIWPRVWPRA